MTAFADSKPVMNWTAAIGNLGIGLWVWCGSWSAKEETDGRVPDDSAQLGAKPQIVAALTDWVHFRLENFESQVDGGMQFNCGQSGRKLAELQETCRLTRSASKESGSKAQGAQRPVLVTGCRTV